MKTVRSILLSILLIFSLGACVPDDLTVNQDYSHQDSREAQSRTADVEGVHITVNSYSILFSEYRGVEPRAKGYFLVVQYSAYNVSSSSGYFNPKTASAVTTALGEYKLSEYGPNDFPRVNETIQDLPRKSIASGILLFEMPAGTTPDFIVFNMPNSDETEIIDLEAPDSDA